MPTQRRFNYQLGGKGFMLVRDGSARSWHRDSKADVPGQRSSEDAKYGRLPDELDHPEVWTDWSGGFGHAYRDTGANTYHWAENFDARFPNQLVHCQKPLEITASAAKDVQYITYAPVPLVGAANPYTPQNEGPGVFVSGGYGFAHFTPGATGSVSLEGQTVKANRIRSFRSVLTASNILQPILTASNEPILHVTNGLGEVTGTFTLPYLHMARANDRIWIAIGGSGNIRPVVRSIVGDPTTTANLTASLPVGPELSAINDMVVLEDQLIVGLNNGLYVGDQSGTFSNVLPMVDRTGNPDNFRDLMTWQGGILAQTTQAVWFYQAEDYTAHVGQITIPAGRSPIKGYVRAFSHCGPWVYAGLWTGSTTYIIATRDIPSPSTPRWHTLQRFDRQAVNRMFFDGITTRSTITTKVAQRFYAAMGADFASTYPLYAWQVPFNDDNPLIPQVAFSANYVGSAQIDLGAVDWGAPATPKIMRSVDIWSEKLASGAQWCKVFYDIDQSGSFTLLGTVAKSPRDVIYFPSGEGSFITGYSVELRLQSFTGSPGITPVYRSVILRGALQPYSVDLITAVTRIADGVRDAHGMEMRSAATMIKELRDFGNPAAQGLQAHQLIDPTGAAQWVKVLGHPEEHEVYQEGEDYPEIAATVRMAVLTYS